MPLMSPAKPRAMTDRIIAMRLLGTAGVGASALSSASVAASNPDLKRLYRDYLQEVITGAEALKTYVTDQGWMKPYATPEEQLHMAIENADEIISVKA